MMPTIDHNNQRVMLIGRDRICYRGLLGEPQRRALGAFAIYVAPQGELRLRAKGERWNAAGICCVEPCVVHDVISPCGTIIVLLIEPETVEEGALDALARTIKDPAGAAELCERIRSNVDVVAEACNTAPFAVELCDRLLLGRSLNPRRMEARVARILNYLRDAPDRHISAEVCASRAHLSVSQFLRVFKANVGVTYRAFRAWRRSRGILNHVNRPTNLALFALDAGYPDSTYFCHATRKIWGLQPSAIFAGSRRLKICAVPASR